MAALAVVPVVSAVFPLGSTPVWAADDAPASASSWLESARTHAFADEHAEAIADYRRAFEQDPALADRWAHELGHQLTWADRPDAAIPWYRRRLEADPTDIEAGLGLARALGWADRTEDAQRAYEQLLEGHPGNLEARRGRARMMAWQDRLEAARAAYEEILDDHPADLETRLQHAQVVNWSGRHSEAAQLYRDILANHPGDRQATVGLAQALRWGGREREALRALDPIHAHEDAAELYRDLRRSAAPVARLGGGWTGDSDDLRILTTEASWEGYTRGDLRARVVLRDLRFEEDGQPDLAARGLNLGGSRSLGDRTAANLYVGFLRFGSDGPITASGATDDLRWTLLTYDGWLTWHPRPRLRVDFASDRGFVETPRSLGHRTSVTHLGLSAEFRGGARWSVGALLREGFYSDSNGRTLARVSLDTRRGRGWVLRAGPRLSVFRFHAQRDRGYWNPGDFLSAAFSLALADERPGHRLRPRLELAPAHEWEDGNGYGVLAWSIGLGVELTDGWHLDLGGGRSDSRLSTDGGYERKWARVVLEWRH